MRRQLSLTPSAPRFVRLGDIFEAGVIVTISGGSISRIPVTVNIEIAEDSKYLISMQDDSKTIIETDADGQIEMRFGLRAGALGDANFVIRAGELSAQLLISCVLFDLPK